MNGTYKIRLSPDQDPMSHPLVVKLMKLPNARLEVQENVPGREHIWDRVAVIQASGAVKPKPKPKPKPMVNAGSTMRLETALKLAYANQVDDQIDESEYWDSVIELLAEKSGLTVTKVTQYHPKTAQPIWSGWIVSCGAVLGVNACSDGWCICRAADGTRIPRLAYSDFRAACQTAREMDSAKWANVDAHQEELKSEIRRRMK